MITFNNLNPGPADGTNILLGKICSRLGGLTQPGDSTNDLLAKILTQLLSVGGSGFNVNGNLGITGDLNVLGDSIFNGLVTINNDLTVGLTGRIYVQDWVPADGTPAIWAFSDHNVALTGITNDLEGVYGASQSSWGVAGVGNDVTAGGVKGNSTSGSGVYGLSVTGAGVLGESTGNAGVRGNSINNSGVLGVSQTQTGVQGIADSSIGVSGSATSGIGVSALSATGTAIVGTISGGATALLSLVNNVTEKLSVSILGLIKCIGLVPTPVVLTPAAAAVTPDFSTGTHFQVTLGDATTTINNPTNPTNGQRVVFELIQDNAGSRALALGAKFAFGTDITAAVLTVTGNKRDFLTTIYNSTADKHYVVAFVKGY